MIELLVKYKTKINWINSKDWDVGANWSFDNTTSFYSKEFQFGYNVIPILKKNLLRINKRYRISFDLVDGLKPFTGGVYFKSGTNQSSAFLSKGNHSFIITSQSSLFEILPVISFGQFGIKNLTIEELEYESLDCVGVDINLNKSISDIKNLSEMSGVYSQDFELIGTEKNNSFFEYIFEITSDSKFNLNVKCDAIISKDGYIIEEGYIQLLNIINKEGFIIYVVAFYSNIINLMNIFGDKYLDELDLSYLDHKSTYQNVIDSWNNLKPYYYGYINYGGNSKYPNNSIQYQNLWGGVVGTGTDTEGTGMVIGDLYPSVYVKSLLDEIFEQAGFTYDSTILNSQIFEKLILPFTNKLEVLNGWHVVAENLIGNNFTNVDDKVLVGSFNWFNRSYHSSYTTGEWKLNTNLKIDKGTGIFLNQQANQDYYNQLNQSSNFSKFNQNTHPQNHLILPGCYRCFREGKYKINTSFGLTNWPNSLGGEGSYKYKIFAFRINVGSNFVFSQTSGYFLITQKEKEIKYIGEYQFNSGAHNFEAEFDCGVGDIIGFKIVAKENQHTPDIVNSQPNLWYTGRIYNTKVSEYQYGRDSFIEGKNIVPKMKIKEFLKSLFLMANLYVEQDKENPYNYIIETRDDFYNSGNTWDWSEKIDRKEIKIETPKDFSSKILKLKYSNDSDYWNDRYRKTKDVNEVGYGGKQYEFQNDFSEDIEDIELNFGSTPLLTYRDFTTSTSQMNITYSEISEWKGDETIPKIKTDWEPRILFANKIRPNEFNTSVSFPFRFEKISFDVDYPYIGHVLNPYDTTTLSNFDINFETPVKTGGVSQLTFIPKPSSTMTNINLFNSFWKKYLDEINDKNSRVITAQFNLSTLDYYNLSFRDFILIDNVYYYVNSINNFVVDGSELTEVELVKVINNLPTFEKTTTGFNVVEPENPKPIDISIFRKPGPMDLKSTNTTYTDDFENVVIINGRNIRVDEDDVVYIDGLKIKGSEITPVYSLIRSNQNKFKEFSDAKLLINGENGHNKYKKATLYKKK
jgi:hypothetical protein